MNIPHQQTALITGASRGIGRAIARKLADQGIFVYVDFRSDDTAAQNTLNDIQTRNGHAALLRFDVTSQDPCDNAACVDGQVIGVNGGLI